MNRLAVAATLSLALTGATPVGAALGQAARDPDPKIGQRITITGCLHEGTARDSFVLLGVTERPADAPAPIVPVPIAIYWLDSTHDLKPLVGQMVDITGKVTRRAPKPGTITFAIDPSVARSTDVNVEGGSRDVTTKKFDDRPRSGGTSGPPSSFQMTRPVYMLAVGDVRAVGAGATGPACK